MGGYGEKFGTIGESGIVSYAGGKYEIVVALSTNNLITAAQQKFVDLIQRAPSDAVACLTRVVCGAVRRKKRPITEPTALGEDNTVKTLQIARIPRRRHCQSFSNLKPSHNCSAETCIVRAHPRIKSCRYWVSFRLCSNPLYI